MTTPGAVPDWQSQRTDAAAQRILDTAEKMYGAHGIDSVTMRALAAEVGCSRATLYRYFPSRDAVQAAFVDRSAAQVARRIAASSAMGDPAERLVSAVTTALRLVRENPALANWFRADGATTAAALAVVSPAIETLARDFLSDLGDSTPVTPSDEFTEPARWLVRIMLSLLTTPGASPADEVNMLRTFVVPVVLDPSHPSA